MKNLGQVLSIGIVAISLAMMTSLDFLPRPNHPGIVVGICWITLLFGAVGSVLSRASRI